MKNILIFLLAFIIGCGSGYEYWHISKFRIRPHALKDGEPIKLLYSSRGPGETDDPYFIHVIVVSQNSGDTVNVLTITDNDFNEDSGVEVLNFISADSDIARVLQKDLSSLERIDLDRLQKPDFSNIIRVARDPEFDYIADNKYPSVIGWIGKAGNATE